MSVQNAESTPENTTPMERGLILAVLTLVTALYAMTITIANVSLPQMQGALSATTDQIALVVTFNIIATAVATPMSGWLSARFSRRTILIWGVGGFTVSSLLCGLATSLESLILFRIMQGAFGAPLAPISQSIVMDHNPGEKRGPAIAIFGMGVIIGPVLAPTVGGILSEAYGWRWVFLMIVPFGIAAMVGVMIFVKRMGKRRVSYLDWSGFVLLSIFIAAFQFGLDRGERLDWFDSNTILICAAVAGLSFYLFIVHTITFDRPFLNPAIFKDRNYTLGCVIVFVFGMLNFTPMTLLPPMLQFIQGYPDSVLGTILGARGVGTLIGFTFMFKGSKLDPRYTLSAGFLFQGIAGWYMSQFSVDFTLFDAIWTSTLQGLGVGLIWVPLTIITFSTLEEHYTTEATAIFHLVRNFGSSIFISISVAVALRTARINYSELSANVSPFNDAMFYQATMFGVWSFDTGKSLAGLSGEIYRQSAMIGYLNAFYLFAILAFIVTPIAFLAKMKRK